MHNPYLSWLLLARKGFAALFLVSLLLASLAYQVKAAPPTQSPEEGQDLFKTKCSACHTIGGGPLSGPDLQGVTARRDPAWLLRWITVPDQMLNEGDPIATQLLQEYNNIPMPNMQLSQTEAKAVIAYLDAQSGAPAAAPLAEQAAPAITGDPAAGRALFVGTTPLSNGGPACISCHHTSQVGALGGGTLGPDLTQVATRYGDAGLNAALQGLPFPTMQGVFDDQPLTEEEAANLYAYFVQTNDTTEQPVNYTLVWIGLGGSILLGLLGHAIWSNRQTGVRQALVHQSRIR